MRVLEPRSLTVLTTSRCTAACRHCNMNSGPQRGEALSWPRLQRLLSAWFAEVRTEVVVFAGGEPTLLGPVLERAVRLCKDHGALTRVVTNASFAATRQEAERVLGALRQAGLDEVNISVDDYHLPWISLQRVRCAYESALELGFSAVVLVNCHGTASALTPERLASWIGQDGTAAARRLGVGGRETEIAGRRGPTLMLLTGSPVQRIGRGRQEIGEAEQAPGPSADELADLGGCPWAVRSPALSPRGHLLACCGFELEDNPVLDYGDLATAGPAALLDRADDDLVTNLIALYGPPWIKRALEGRWPDEVSFPGAYQTYCEVCHDLVWNERNRRALYRRQGEFLSAVLAARAEAAGRGGEKG